jgi:hypothetical protein
MWISDRRARQNASKKEKLDRKARKVGYRIAALGKMLQNMRIWREK